MKGRKRTMRGDEKVTGESKISIKTIGIILELLALPIIIVNIVLLKMPNTDIGASTVLLVVSNIMFFTGMALHHLPKETENKGEREKE